MIKYYNCLKRDEPLGPLSSANASLLESLAPRLPIIYDSQIDRNANAQLSAEERAIFTESLQGLPQDTEFCCLDQEAPFHTSLIRPRINNVWYTNTVIPYYRMIADFARNVRPEIKFGIWGQPWARQLLSNTWRSLHDVTLMYDYLDVFQISGYVHPTENAASAVSNRILAALRDASTHRQQRVQVFLMPFYEGVQPFWGNANAVMPTNVFKQQIEACLSAAYVNTKIHAILLWGQVKSQNEHGVPNPLINYYPGDTTIDLAYLRYMNILKDVVDQHNITIG